MHVAEYGDVYPVNVRSSGILPLVAAVEEEVFAVGGNPGAYLLEGRIDGWARLTGCYQAPFAPRRLRYRSVPP